MKEVLYSILICVSFSAVLAFGKETEKKDAIKQPVKQSKNNSKENGATAEKKKCLFKAWKKMYTLEIRRTVREIKQARRRARKGDRYEQHRLPQLKRVLLTLKKERRELKQDKLVVKEVVADGFLVRSGAYYRVGKQSDNLLGEYYFFIDTACTEKIVKKLIGKKCRFKLYIIKNVGFVTYVYAAQIIEIKIEDVTKEKEKEKD